MTSYHIQNPPSPVPLSLQASLPLVNTPSKQLTVGLQLLPSSLAGLSGVNLLQGEEDIHPVWREEKELDRITRKKLGTKEMEKKTKNIMGGAA